jgi:hypothetical protein
MKVMTFRSKCEHREPEQLSYRDFIEDAIERVDKGEIQLKCPVCGRFIWESLYTIE